MWLESPRRVAPVTPCRQHQGERNLRASRQTPIRLHHGDRLSPFNHVSNASAPSVCFDSSSRACRWLRDQQTRNAGLHHSHRSIELNGRVLNANEVIRLLLLADVLFAAIACGPAQSARSAQGVGDSLPIHWYYTPSSERDSLLAVLAANERRWNRLRLQQYTATMQVGCGICPTTVLVLDVDAGLVVTPRDSTGNPKSTYNQYAAFTFDSLFKYAETAIRDRTQRVRVRFDADLGYPREIITDHPEITDSRFRIRIDSVHRVTMPTRRVAPLTQIDKPDAEVFF